jgi:hypothetical protein
MIQTVILWLAYELRRQEGLNTLGLLGVSRTGPRKPLRGSERQIETSLKFVHVSV